LRHNIESLYGSSASGLVADGQSRLLKRPIVTRFLNALIHLHNCIIMEDEAADIELVRLCFFFTAESLSEVPPVGTTLE
jgi:hypothetical protein